MACLVCGMVAGVMFVIAVIGCCEMSDMFAQNNGDMILQ